MIIKVDCLEHQSHLMTLQGLKTADKLLQRFGAGFRYFSSVATVSNTLRDVAKDVFAIWCDLHGDRSGVKHAKKLWPKLIGGRWNSCHDVENRLISCGGQQYMKPVLKCVLAKKTKAEGQSAVSKVNDYTQVVDELSFEDSKAFQKKMSRWRANTASCCQHLEKCFFCID